jgi:hypothetical protein
MFFFLKFKAQLRKTRPEIVRNVDDSLLNAITASGGKITGDRFVISAVFDDDTIGFWLDMYILIENLKKSIASSSEFFGFSLVISSKPPDHPEMLCRFLANHNGVFVNDKIAGKMVPYALFEKPSEWLSEVKRRKYGCGSYYKISELKVFNKMFETALNLNKEVLFYLRQYEGKSMLVIGPPHSLMRGGVYDHCNDFNGEFPPLTVCFGSSGLGPLIDLWSLNIRTLSGKPTEEIDNAWELLFRERMRDEVSDYIIRSVKRFLHMVFDYYFQTAKKKKKTPVLVLENVHLAGNTIIEVLIDVVTGLDDENRRNLLVLGISEDDLSEERRSQTENIFKKAVKLDNKTQNKIVFPRLSTDLWEIIYAITLLNRYFSPELFQQLFEEENKNPVMITRAFSILYSLGIIDNTREPRLVNRNFEDYARRVLGERCSKVHELVRGRLLSWAVRRNINPCFRLLMVISVLEGTKEIDDLLLLKAFSSDIINETVSGIETALKTGQFEDLVGARAAAISYIYKTSMVLYAGKEDDIERIFTAVSSETLYTDCDPYPVLKAQILVNLSAYYLGRNDKKEAAGRAKDAIMICQSSNTYCLAQSYRIFSLVCLSKQQINETIEYLSFAISNAEKSGNYQELAISAYYSAAAQFLFGDVYNAAKFARKSTEQSLASGLPDWADRSRFLEGRIEFDLGHYSKAHDIFESIRNDPYGKKTKEKDSTLAAWIYRSLIYSKDPKTPKPEAASYDADLFELEASYMAGDYKRTVELSGFLTNPFAKENFLYTEQADWRSGYSQCEHLYFTQGEVQNRMISIFNALAKSCLSAQGSEEGIQSIQQILRDEKLCEMDPWDAFYFYAKYRILEQSSANPVDLSTAVSMAFKRLQRRAGRIEDIETRRQYLNGPHWNSE